MVTFGQLRARKPEAGTQGHGRCLAFAFYVDASPTSITHRRARAGDQSGSCRLTWDEARW
ncbi:hypothetical protein HBB16_01540 [Pseudonocardia sp. MCCB 268]|nr:hypothetical protein [Pseudonocardia cytotoxica]